uniref:Uncharacterized protein n=1 Tax=Chromera velia CCMP2878 TaxID=1169474 RepID=A0A0G4IE37_9ALVE|eukprot:Cvel_13629.t1-p1 / transcript=Cvel_13629.t1 / gene=Cvel_13629 / organism=Chromera_velia_CCMP2878 / gene_product=hypothetical protein / transcript_product=hypothetical protein / location=Cvel_scaffold939:30577-31785(-) / protein_length=403 / sequence_SO=supercontig / SO=protein_coding / is_pseudo=false
MSVLCRFLGKASLPCLRVLLLKGCGFNDGKIEEFAEFLGRGDMPLLETLDLSMCKWAEKVLGPFGKALSQGADKLRCLRNLSLMTERGERSAGDVATFLEALASPACPPLKNVSLFINTAANTADLRALANGRYPVVRTLRLEMLGGSLEQFLRALVDSPSEPQFESLSLKLGGAYGDDLGSVEWVRLLGEAARRRRLSSLREIDACFSGPEDHLKEAIECFFGSLGLVKLPFFSILRISRAAVSDVHLSLLGDAVRAGNLSGLEVLDLSQHDHRDGFGRVGLEALTYAITETEEGLPHLKELRLQSTKAGKALESLAKALIAGKLGNLSALSLDSCSLTGAGLGALGSAVRAGALVHLTSLSMGQNGLDGGDWEGEFYAGGAIAESEAGLHASLEVDRPFRE